MKNTYCIPCEDVLKCVKISSPDGSVTISKTNNEFFLSVEGVGGEYAYKKIVYTPDIVINGYYEPGTTTITLPDIYSPGSVELFINGQARSLSSFQEISPNKLKILDRELKNDETLKILYKL